MKKLILFAALAVCAQAFSDASYSVTVTTNSTIVLPYADASGLSITAWSTGTAYDQGDYCRVGGARYWTPNGGTSTNQPSHIEGKYEYDDGVTWVRITNSDRRIALITNWGTNQVWASYGNISAVSTNGFPVFGYETFNYEGQGEVKMVLSSGTTLITVAEEDE